MDIGGKKFFALKMWHPPLLSIVLTNFGLAQLLSLGAGPPKGDKNRGAPTRGQSLTPETRIGKYLTTPTMQMANCKSLLFKSFLLLFHFYLTAPKYLNHNYLMLRVFFHSVVSKYLLEFCTKMRGKDKTDTMAWLT